MTFPSDRVAVPTFDHDAERAARSEQALIGALLLDGGRAWPRVKDLVSEEDFKRHDHRLIFRAIVKLMEEAGCADHFLVIDELGRNLDDAGGAEYIAELRELSPSAENAEAYARAVRNHALRSKVIDLGAEIRARALLGGNDPAEFTEFARREVERLVAENTAPIEPLPLVPASEWAKLPPPPAREWVLEGMIPAGRVTSLLGVGGLGKTLAALQIALHVSIGRPVFGLNVSPGPVLGILCEDETDELRRRLMAACAGEGVDLSVADRLVAMSRDGFDNVLCTFERDHIRLTRFYHELEATIALQKPKLVILDTAADVFAGDFMSTPHVRQFIKVALGGLCVRHGCAILLLAHPSAAGAQSGDGGGFSVAWSNSVRSRLYLAKPKKPDSDESVDIADKRILSVKKSNYGRDDLEVPLTWVDGYFVRDDEPYVDSGPKAARANSMRISIAALEIIREHDPAVMPFKRLFELLQERGVIPPGPYDIRRKPLFRALRQLIADGLIRESTIPRGYRAEGMSR